jgi:hypothetical protein
MLLPGYSLTFAITEVTTKRFLCGMIGIFRALYAAALLGLGLAIGSSGAFAITEQFVSPPALPEDQCRASPNRFWFILFYPLMIGGINHLI